MKYVISKNDILHLTQDTYSFGDTLCGHKYDCDEGWEEVESSQKWYYTTCKNCERILGIAETYADERSESNDDDDDNNSYIPSTSGSGMGFLIQAGVMLIVGAIALFMPRDRD
jgi:hypothetical protein